MSCNQGAVDMKFKLTERQRKLQNKKKLETEKLKKMRKILKNNEKKMEIA